MSSRQEQKEQRRQERLEAEAAAARASTRTRRLQIGGGAVLVVAAIAAIAVIAMAGGDDGGGGDGGGDSANLAADARAAGCQLSSYRSEGQEHTSEKVTTYKTNPPTSGPHNPVAAEDGIYAAGNEAAVESWVHSLEHGRVLFQYKPGSPDADVRKLRAIAEEEFNDSPGYHVLMFQNNTSMGAQYAAVSWTKSLTCDRLTPRAEDVMRAFRAQFTDRAPEFIP